jgi:carboxypeptidase PM20D1
MGIMEAVEALLADGYKPLRTLYLAFGPDEEVGGQRGAAKIAELFKSRGIKADYILDESGAITTGVVPWVSTPVALVGIAEKGYLSLKLSVEHEGGHSSMPPLQSAIGILASAIHNLERNQFPANLEGPTMQLFDYVGPEMPFGMKFLVANKWLFGRLIKGQLMKFQSTCPAVRTTIAVTVIRAGQRENVLPQSAQAIVNFRLFPGDSIEDVMEHVKTAIGDSRVKISIPGDNAIEASKISDVNSEGFKILESTIRQVFPDAIVAPYLVPAATDARHYSEISGNILRFLPTRMNSEDLKRIHGTNERVDVENYKEVVQFYVQMIRNSN